MRAVVAAEIHLDDPLRGLRVVDIEPPLVPDGWVAVDVRAAALNHHDLWSLRGVGLTEDRLPMVLGSDAAGSDADGNRVLVHAVIGDPGAGDETLDPERSLLSERYPGTLAGQVRVPAGNLVALPDELSFEEAACLPTAWLTAYRMLTRDSGLPAGGGGTVLVQGAGGGVSSAATHLAVALGHTVYVTSRSEALRARVLAAGAEAALASGERLPVKVDCVIESVGEATWGHSLRSLRPGGTVVVCGATSGPNPPAELNRVFFLQLRVIGSTMGSRAELEALVALVARTGLHPPIEAVHPLDDAPAAFARLADGDVDGKVLLTP
jgi:NADPH:quinone reductase-like Zn-dependent oxidoreductase